MSAKRTALLVWAAPLPRGAGDVDVLIGPRQLESSARERGLDFVALESFEGAENIYEGRALLEEISRLAYPDGTKIASSVSYQGFDLWWTHYNALMRNFCLPYSQHKKILAHLETYKKVYLHQAPHSALFSYYLNACGVSVVLSGLRRGFSAGLFLQAILTLVSVAVLAIVRPRVMVFIGDKLEQGTDRDFRMGPIYAHLRERGVHFMECVRSIESWRVMLRNAGIRRRPVVYSEALSLLARGMSALSVRPLRAATTKHLVSLEGRDSWKCRVAAHYLLSADEDVWAVRITRTVFKLIGFRAGLFTAILERNVHAAIACKLLEIPTVGILHGVATPYSTVYDFLKGFTGRRFTTDVYGVWSNWWKEYFEKESDAYAPEQLVVSGPMRPLSSPPVREDRQGPIRVLFMSEQRAVPEEVLPYLEALIAQGDIEVTMKFRPFRDGFEEWLKMHTPELLSHPKLGNVRGSMEHALAHADAVVGCHSTGILEGLLQSVVPIFLYTPKWGDYYGMGATQERSVLLARTLDELLARVRGARDIPPTLLQELREQYFGESGKDGSRWAVDLIEKKLAST